MELTLRLSRLHWWLRAFGGAATAASSVGSGLRGDWGESTNAAFLTGTPEQQVIALQERREQERQQLKD